MTARRLYDAGYRDLVSVVPPDAPISSSSSLRPEARGKVPGKQKPDGTWVGYDFVRAPRPSEDDLARWEDSGANVGLKADSYPGLDIDCDNPILSRLLVQEAKRLLGPAPVRTSREPRRLLVYRTDEPFTRIVMTVTFAGKEHKAEVLGKGRQYLVCGKHPSGRFYGWEGLPLWETPPDRLTMITAEDVLIFFEEVRRRLSGRAEVRIQGTGAVKDAAAPPQEELLAPDAEALQEVVGRIPNDYPDRDTYIQVGHAIKAAGGEEAFDLWSAWAAKWEGGNEPETVEADWQRMHPPFRVGWSYLQDLAAQRSDYVVAQDEFEADSEAELEVGKGGEGLPINQQALVYYLEPKIAPKARWVEETGSWHTWGGNHA